MREGERERVGEILCARERERQQKRVRLVAEAPCSTEIGMWERAVSVDGKREREREGGREEGWRERERERERRIRLRGIVKAVQVLSWLAVHKARSVGVHGHRLPNSNDLYHCNCNVNQTALADNRCGGWRMDGSIEKPEPEPKPLTPNIDCRPSGGLRSGWMDRFSVFWLSLAAFSGVLQE